MLSIVQEKLDTPRLLVGECIETGGERRTELTVHLGLDETTRASNIDVSRSSKTSFVSIGDEKEEKKGGGAVWVIAITLGMLARLEISRSTLGGYDDHRTSFRK